MSLYRNNVGNTNYNALEAKLEKRFSGGLGFLVSYTRSKLIDEASSVFDASILTGPVVNFPVADSLNRRLERNLSTGDIPNVFVSSFTYELPCGPGKHFSADGIVGALIRDWELRGCDPAVRNSTRSDSSDKFQTHLPALGTQRPNRVVDPNFLRPNKTTALFFNTAAFCGA